MGKFLKNFFGFNYYNDIRVPSYVKIICFFGIYLLLLKMNSIFLWFSHSYEISLMVSVIIIMGSIYLESKKLMGFNKNNMAFAFFSILYFLFLWFKDISNFNLYMLVRLVPFGALTCMILWHPVVLKTFYKYLFRFITIISFFSAIITVLSAFGMLGAVPYYVMDSAEDLHKAVGITYRVYGLSVTTVNPFDDYFLKRACGILCEPGHFSILLGIFYTIERLQKHKLNIPIFVCGLLTLSPNFIFIYIFVELWLLLREKKFGRNIRRVMTFIFAIFLIFVMLPSDVQDSIYYFIFDRNLVNMWETLTTTNSIESTLDNRVNAIGMSYYERIWRSSDLWTGMMVTDQGISLSDYRGLIVRIGLVGTVLTVFEIFASVTRLKIQERVPLLFILILIFAHRAWMLTMFYQLYLVFVGRSICMHFLPKAQKIGAPNHN